MCYILHYYPSVKLEQFYSSFKKGGLTYYQIETLFELSSKHRMEEYEIIGAFHGISPSNKDVVPKSQLPEGVSDHKKFVFGDPDSYKNLSSEERENLTQEMMGNHKKWSSSGGIGGKK